MVKADPEARLADAAFKLLARMSWSDLTLAAAAKAAKIQVNGLYAVAPTKTALLRAMLRRIGQETTAQYRTDKQSVTPRERFFDVAMTWFDVLEKRKKAMRALYEGLRRDPFAFIALRNDAIAEAQWLLALAEADQGSSSPLKAAAIAGMLVRALPVWLDDNADMTKTMARLDGDLRRAERFLWPRVEKAAAKQEGG
jgi:AcrR family transcriptional regulator